MISWDKFYQRLYLESAIRYDPRIWPIQLLVARGILVLFFLPVPRSLKGRVSYLEVWYEGGEGRVRIG